MIGDFAHLADRPHFVYRCFDAAGDLLYVGVTCDLEQRFSNHRHTAAWFADLASVKFLGPFTGPDARRRAFRAEAKVIADERPLHNRDRGLAQLASASHRRRPAVAA